ATALEAGQHQNKGLLAPQMESGTMRPQASIQPSRDMATTGLGQAGMRAYAKWQGLNSEPNSSLLPSLPTGYSSGLSVRPQLSTPDYGYGVPAGQNANSKPLAQPAVMSDRDYVESIKRRAA